MVYPQSVIPIVDGEDNVDIRVDIRADIRAEIDETILAVLPTFSEISG